MLCVLFVCKSVLWCELSIPKSFWHQPDACVHCSTTITRRVLFEAAAEAAPPTAAASRQQGFSGAPLDPADPRVRRVPFVTQRPTLSELKRALWVLGSVRRVTLPDPAEQQQQEAAGGGGSSKQDGQQQQGSGAAAAAAVDAVVVPPMPAVKKQVCGWWWGGWVGGRAGTGRQGAAVLCVRATALTLPYTPSMTPLCLSCLCPPCLPKTHQTHQDDPPLIKASKAGDAERVARLLSNGHDPTVRDSKGRSPYQLAANKEVGVGVERGSGCDCCVSVMCEGLCLRSWVFEFGFLL